MKRKFALMVVLILLVNSFAFADTDDYVSWNWENGTSSMSIQIFTSAYSDFNSYISSCYDDWNGIIPNKVFISSTTYNIYNDNKDCDIRFIGEELTGTTMASTGIYTKFLGILIQKNFWSFTGSVEVSKITLDTRSSNGLLSKSDSQIKKTITHEIGHALALDHPDCGSTALMQQGYSSPASLTIVTHDEDNLEAKWN